jgi:hypothetical protein
MSQAVKGSFTSGASVGIGEISAELVIPSNYTTMKLSLGGTIDASNTCKTQMSTDGQAWADQTTYNSAQTNTAITVAHGQRWRLVSVTQQALKAMDYGLSVES